MNTNYEGLQVIHDFLWSGKNNMGNALTSYHMNPNDCEYTKDYILKCYRELLERIIEDGFNYKSAEQCIFNCSS